MTSSITPKISFCWRGALMSGSRAPIAQGSNRVTTSKVISRGDLLRSCFASTMSTSLNLPLALRLDMKSDRAVALEALALGDDHLEPVRLLLVLGDLGVEPPDLRRQAPPPDAKHQDDQRGDSAEEHAEVEARDRETHALL